jgi:hypothetical protein
MTEVEWRKWIRERVQAADPMLWVLASRLACSPRPLRYHPAYKDHRGILPSEAHDELYRWVDRIRWPGIGLIVCLATAAELRRYTAAAAPQPGLLDLYRSQGIEVHHLPVEDPHHASSGAKVGIKAQLELLKPRIHILFRQSGKATLLHCSGGMDRSTPIAAYIAARESQAEGAG